MVINSLNIVGQFSVLFAFSFLVLQKIAPAACICRVIQCVTYLPFDQLPVKQLPIGSPPQVNNGGGGAIPRRRINSNPFAANSRPTTLMSQSWTPNSILCANPNQLHPQQQQQQQNSPSSLMAPSSATPTKGNGDPFGNPSSSSSNGKNAVPPEPKICPATGNMFQRRKDLSVFHTLPYPKRNPYHIKIDDEGPHGKNVIFNLG